ncbi:hypothetical protein [Microbacterium paraoxydans]|uniref:hypothetical protein n=1 Tax=Microbacterium paraoxydans TaxID=199592 RepID=UPI001CF952E6|nr:hypothetical protein [Microbacterium paraoxydans]
MTAADDEIQALLNGYRQLSSDVPSTLLSRGWTCVNVDAADDDALEWVWPPTAPIGYRGLREWVPPGARARPGMHVPRRTPWTAPTRFLQHPGAVWDLRYGEALAQQPDAPKRFTADAELLDDLDRIESWPMSVEERRREERNRLWNTTVADAHNDHYLGMPITEPYGSWLDEIDARLEARDGRVDDAHSSELEFGDLHAQRRLVDAAAWASAHRTARLGGPGWSSDGPD